MFHINNTSAPGASRGSASLWIRFSLCLICVAGAVGCRRDMQDMPRYEVYEESDFFADRAASRPIPEGTVARGYLREDDHLYLGRVSGAGGGGGASRVATTAGVNTRETSPEQNTVAERPDLANDTVASPGSATTEFDPNLATTFPFPVTRALIDRGEERFRAYCMMCHGLTGDGDGMIVRRGYKRPTSYHTDRLRAAPVGHFFDVITNGWGSMPNYSDKVTPRDRWAIIAYIRALQLSQGATIDDIPESERQQITSGANQAPAVQGGAHSEQGGH